MLLNLGQQALELQLERFFTVWAWKWDIEDDDFGNHLGKYLPTILCPAYLATYMIRRSPPSATRQAYTTSGQVCLVSTRRIDDICSYATLCNTLSHTEVPSSSCPICPCTNSTASYSGPAEPSPCSCYLSCNDTHSI